ncbi:MAG: ABC transporter substrate-binding protein [Marinobacter sp.]
MFRPTSVIAVLVFSMLSALPIHAADTIAVKIGYIQWAPDQGPVLSNVLPEPEDAGLRGAELAISDNSTTGKFMGHTYTLTSKVAESEQAAVKAFEALQQQGVELFVINAPASTLNAMMDKASPATLVFNSGSSDDSLRADECHPNLLHTLPSYAMLTDALGQWLKMRRWSQVFLITGPTAADQAWASAAQLNASA